MRSVGRRWSNWSHWWASTAWSRSCSTVSMSNFPTASRRSGIGDRQADRPLTHTGLRSRSGLDFDIDYGAFNPADLHGPVPAQWHLNTKTLEVSVIGYRTAIRLIVHLLGILKYA